MLKGINKQTTIAATSVVDIDSPTGKTEVPIVYMSATIQSDGKFNIGQAIQNEEIYFQNTETAKADYDKFYELALEIAKDKNE